MITPQDKDDILQIISNISPAKIDNIDTGVVYDTTQQVEIEKIYDAEIEEIIESLISQNVDIQNLSSLDKTTLESKKDDMMNNFNSQVIASLDGSSLIKLLRPISDALYQKTWNNKSKTLTIRVDSIVSQINTEIKEKEKQEEAQRRLQAEVALRQEQERTRAAQEQAYRAEQALRVYREREEAQRQAEIQRKRVEEAERKRQEQVKVEATIKNVGSGVISYKIEDKVKDGEHLKKLSKQRDDLFNSVVDHAIRNDPTTSKGFNV